MAVPWLQIVQLVPSIVEVSRELLKRTRRPPALQDASLPQTADELTQRVLALEENERRQAELVSEIADQLSNLTRAVTAMHRQMMWLSGISAIAIIVALVAIGIAAAK